MEDPNKAATAEPDGDATLQGLRSSIYRLNIMLDSLVEGVAQFDRGGRLQSANPSARRILPDGGLEDLVARSVGEDGEPWPPGAHPVALALKKGLACTGLVMGIRKPEGSLLWVSCHATPLLYPSREPWGLVLSLTDITERRQLQRRTEAVADLLQMAQVVEDEGALAGHLADRLALWSGCAQVTIQITEGPRHHLHTNHDAPQATPQLREDPGPLWSNHASLQAGTGPQAWRELAQAGWESVAILPLHLGDPRCGSLAFLDPRPGRFEGLPLAALEEVAGITANILAKALAQRALRERADALARSRGQLAQAQALAGLGSWTLDLISQERSWSPETYLQWDCDPALPPPPFAALQQKVHPEDRPAFQAFHETLGEARYTVELEVRTLAPTGAVRHLLLQAIPLTGASEPPGRIQGASMDITGRKSSELALRDLAKLSAKGQMAAYIAHEINNPLAGIRNAFLLLERAIPPEHPHRSYVPLITREIDRIASIIRTMYHLYRAEPATSRQVVLTEVFYDLESLLAPKVRAFGATIAFDSAGAGPGGILNEGFFRQVLFNLIQNALEASPPGGVVDVTARSAEQWLEVTVGDRGPGIAPGTSEKIFQSGFTTKLDSAMSGLGLGLATCRSLVETMGGTLAFRDRQPGPGTEFTVRLPYFEA